MTPAVVDDDFQQEMAALNSATVIGAERKPGVYLWLLPPKVEIIGLRTVGQESSS